MNLIVYSITDSNFTTIIIAVDEMFHKEISGHAEGFLSMDRIFGCNQVKNMKKENGERMTEADIAAAIADSSDVEYKSGSGVRRKNNKPLPALEGRPNKQFTKKTPKSAHDDGVVFMVSFIKR